MPWGVVVFPSPSILLTFPNPKVGIDSFVSNTKLAILPTSVHQYHMALFYYDNIQHKKTPKLHFVVSSILHNRADFFSRHNIHLP